MSLIKFNLYVNPVVVLLSVFTVVFIVTLILLVRRKDFQPLKSRSVRLIFISTLGNFLFFFAILLNKIL